MKSDRFSIIILDIPMCRLGGKDSDQKGHGQMTEMWGRTYIGQHIASYIDCSVVAIPGIVPALVHDSGHMPGV